MQTLHRIKKNQIEMMQMRGYVIPDEEISILTWDPREDDFGIYYTRLENEGPKGHPLNKIYKGPDLPDIAVFYIKGDGAASAAGAVIKAENVKTYFGDVVGDLPKNVIIISLNKIKAATVKKIIQDYVSYRISVFTESEILINPTKHGLSEKVIGRLTTEEKIKVFKKTPADQLVQLSYDDPIVKFYGFIPGDVILCYRNNLDEKNPQDGYPVKKHVSTNSIYILETNV